MVLVEINACCIDDIAKDVLRFTVEMNDLISLILSGILMVRGSPKVLQRGRGSISIYIYLNMMINMRVLIGVMEI